jgi:peptidoglycan/LPS O-acetylase OafA/YrhL
MRPFLICLSPALLAYAVLLVGVTGGMSGSSVTLNTVITLLAIGALISGACVARHLYRKTGEPAFLKWFLAILSFAGVAVLYFAVTLAGCCGIAMLEDSMRL